MICFYCGKEIDLENESVYYIAFDIPYANIPVHKNTCLREIEIMGTENYAKENLERIYSFSERTPVVPKKKTRRK
jgi:hypothetical protein